MQFWISIIVISKADGALLIQCAPKGNMFKDVCSAKALDDGVYIYMSKSFISEGEMSTLVREQA